jgi:hypothetical protein
LKLAVSEASLGLHGLAIFRQLFGEAVDGSQKYGKS